jgi:hypothetical protein
MKKKNEIIVYQAKNGAIELRGDYKKETIWATQSQMATVFGVNPQGITKHLKNIYKEKELSRESTCSKMEQVQVEGGRSVKRMVEMYSLDAIISVGYRISSKMATRFRQWATKTLRRHITEGYTINAKIVRKNYTEFRNTIEGIKYLLPADANIDNASVLELISAFADTWLSLDAYDKGKLITKGVTRRSVELTADDLSRVLLDFKAALVEKGEASELFGNEKSSGEVTGIVGNVMQSFGGKPVYATIEEKAAHLLYFIVKNHPFIDGNKRSGAYSFIWFLNRAGVLDRSKITPAALTALTLFVAESEPRHKDRMVGLIMRLIR